MRKDIKKLIYNYGMQRILEDLIAIVKDINENNEEEYLNQLIKDLQNTYINYMNRYYDEPEDI
jgi:hydrogenase maturation factor HypE